MRVFEALIVATVIVSPTLAEPITPSPQVTTHTTDHDILEECLKLPVDETLVFTQLEAKHSSNALLQKATGLINQHLGGVLAVDVGLPGDTLHRRVGKFETTAVLRRLTPNEEEVVECYTMSYEVRDTDECLLPKGEPMRHRCHGSATCINKEGSYECGCGEDTWGQKNSGSPSEPDAFSHMHGTCGGEVTTEDCCNFMDEWGGAGSRHLSREKRDLCLQDFKCTGDPCKDNDCDENSWCQAGKGYEDFTCVCKEGFRKVNGSCVVDTVDHCLDNSCPTHCRCQVVVGEGYKCVARAGYTAYTDPSAPKPPDAYPHGRRLDSITACLDGHVPEIDLRGHNPLHFKQGDTYEELGVTVVDKNEEESERKVKIQYSKPFGSYFRETGKYHVDYSIETPFLRHIESITKRRDVFVADVDECTYQGKQQEFRHQCTPELATCRNTHGSYECLCAEGYTGDGLVTGTGCVDTTSPKLTCKGKGCEVAKFRACNCMGMVSSTGGARRLFSDALDPAFIEASILELGGDLCGAEARTVPEEEDTAKPGLPRSNGLETCFEASDEVFGKPAVDLTGRITRGKLEKDPDAAGNMTWRVPHNVVDDAGNAAATVYYRIEVEAVDVLENLSTKNEDRETMYLRVAVIILAVMVFWSALWRLLLFLRTVMAAARVMFFPYSLITSREDFELGYGLVLRIMSMGMATERERDRKIALRWAQLIDEASGGGVCDDYSD